jgi:hypothetical protein
MMPSCNQKEMETKTDSKGFFWFLQPFGIYSIALAGTIRNAGRFSPIATLLRHSGSSLRWTLIWRWRWYIVFIVVIVRNVKIVSLSEADATLFFQKLSQCFKAVLRIL